MAQLASEAIVLQTTDYAEWDRIVSLYTKDFGRIRGIAKSAKRSQRRFGSTLEPFSYVNVFFVAKENQGLIRLERCEIIRAFPDIAQDIRKVVYGNYFLELVHMLTPERQAGPDTFDLLLYFITLLGENDFREDLMRLFELRLFSLLGYQPRFSECVACNRVFDLDEKYAFSIKRGGIVCSRCRPQLNDLLPLSLGTIRVFQQAQNLALLKLNRIFLSQAAHEEGKLIFGKFLEYHIGRRPKSLSIMEQLR